MKLRILAFLALLVATFAAAAQESGWVQVATSQDGNDAYSVKLHSGERSKTQGGAPITVVVGQVVHKLTNQAEVNRWYVTDSDCDRGYGTLVVTDVDGNFQYQGSFAEGGNNVGSAIATAICAAAKAGTNKDVSGGVSS